MAAILTAQHLPGERTTKIKPLPEKTLKNVCALMARLWPGQSCCSHREWRAGKLL